MGGQSLRVAGLKVTGIARSICVEDSDTSEDRISTNSTSGDLIGIDVRCDIPTGRIPEVVLEEAQDLGCLSTRLASRVELLSNESSLDKGLVLVYNGEERRSVDLFPEIVAGLIAQIVSSVLLSRGGLPIRLAITHLIPILTHIPQVVENQWPIDLLVQRCFVKLE